MYEASPNDDSYGADDYFATVNSRTEQPIFNVGNKTTETSIEDDGIYRPLGAYGCENLRSSRQLPEVEAKMVRFPMGVILNHEDQFKY